MGLGVGDGDAVGEGEAVGDGDAVGVAATVGRGEDEGAEPGTAQLARSISATAIHAPRAAARGRGRVGGSGFVAIYPTDARPRRNVALRNGRSRDGR